MVKLVIPCVTASSLKKQMADKLEVAENYNNTIKLHIKYDKELHPNRKIDINDGMYIIVDEDGQRALFLYLAKKLHGATSKE